LAFAVPIFTNLTRACQLFGKNSYTKFHENLLGSLVADTMSWLDGQLDVVFSSDILFIS